MILGQAIADFSDIADPFSETIDAELLVTAYDDPPAGLNTHQKLRKPRLIASAMFSEQQQSARETLLLVQFWRQSGNCFEAFLVECEPVRAPGL
ncbi:hypothetical protein FQZ97_1097680 [compost metagenome]